MKWRQDAVMAKAQFGTQRPKGDLEPSIPTPTDIDEQSLEKLNVTWKKSCGQLLPKETQTPLNFVEIQNSFSHAQ
jgi:hypothetical protein